MDGRRRQKTTPARAVKEELRLDRNLNEEEWQCDDMWGQHWRQRAEQMAKAVNWEHASYVLEVEKIEY